MREGAIVDEVAPVSALDVVCPLCGSAPRETCVRPEWSELPESEPHEVRKLMAWRAEAVRVAERLFS